MDFTDDQLLRYSRHILLPEVGGKGQAKLAVRLPFIREMRPVDGKAAAYLCKDYTCKLPVTDAGEVATLLRSARSA